MAFRVDAVSRSCYSLAYFHRLMVLLPHVLSNVQYLIISDFAITYETVD